MCTLTYLPLGDKGFVFTSNRDEAIDRMPALAPQKYCLNEMAVFYPKDTQANGTWIATAANHYSLCLLNGAFEKHVSMTPYRKSRGLMLLDFFQYNDVARFVAEYEWTNMEPFTLVVIHNETVLEITELRWDGQKLHQKKLSAKQSHIWSSATLYDPIISQEKEQLFKHWLQETTTTSMSERIVSFHLQEKITLESKDKKTVSITSIIEENESKTMLYQDLAHRQTKRFRIY